MLTTTGGRTLANFNCPQNWNLNQLAMSILVCVQVYFFIWQPSFSSSYRHFLILHSAPPLFQPPNSAETLVLFPERTQHRPLAPFTLHMAIPRPVSLCLCVFTWIVGEGSTALLLFCTDCWEAGAWEMPGVWLSEHTALGALLFDSTNSLLLLLTHCFLRYVNTID